MQDLSLEFLWKDIASGGNGCPALIKTPGGYYVQGRTVSGDERAAVQAVADQNHSGLAEGEEVIFVPANVLDRLRD